MITYEWSAPEKFASVVHESCLLTPEVKPKMGIIDDTLRNMRRMDVLGILDNEAPIGAFLFDGHEFHAAILPWYRGKWMTRRFIRLLLEEKRKRGGIYTTLTNASPIVRKSVIHFCNRYGIEVIYA